MGAQGRGEGECGGGKGVGVVRVCGGGVSCEDVEWGRVWGVRVC